MWMQVLIGFSLVSEAHGFSGGQFPQSCGSLLPQHESGSILLPQTSDPPFTITFESGRRPGDPVTVVLSTNGSIGFRGFMLDAQSSSNAGRSPVGQFVIIDSEWSQLLDCYGLKATAVSQTNNQRKTQVKVNWTAEGEERDVVFRATFLETFSRFWNPISAPLPRFTTTVEPSSPRPSDPETSGPRPTVESSSPRPTTNTDVTQTIGSTNGSSDESSDGHSRKVAISLMFLDSIVEEIKMEVFNIQTFLFDSKPFNFGLIKMSLLLGSLLAVGADVSSLVLFRMFSLEVALLSLLIVVASGELLTVLLAVLMPIGPSHELKKVWELVLRGGFAVHQILTTVVLFLGVLGSTDASGRKRGRSWNLNVMIVFTVWILLTQIWNLVLGVHERTILEGNRSDESKRSGRSGTRSLRAPAVTSIITSVTLAVGTAAFAVTLISGLFEEN